MRRLLWCALLLPWVLAAWAWPGLGERFPIHFDAAGEPDGWARTTAVGWFLLPALGSAIGLALGVGLPRWMVVLAQRNSPWLNVPNKKAFAALSTEARVRAVAGPARWLVLLAALLQVLLAWIVFGSARVAAGAWSALPPWPSFCLVAAVVVCALALAFAGTRAVRREVERGGG